jgi:hypothetical protein
MTVIRSQLRSLRRAPRRIGAVMVMTLLALVLLASLLFFVMNLGRQAHTRLQTQNAADAAVAAGSGWVARTFNTVAMHNEGTARLIALVAVLDALPQAVEYAHTDQLAILEAVDGQLSRGVQGSWVREGLLRFRDEIRAEADQLAPMERFFLHSGYDVRRMTHYHPPSGPRIGHLWQAMHAMDAHSLAAMENLDELLLVNGVVGGLVNLAGESPVAVVVPAVDRIPWRRGAFDDFRRPVLHGLLPESVDDRVTNRGPYDVLFGWRDPIAGERRGHHSGRHSGAGGGGPGVPIGRGPGSDTWVQTSHYPERYRVYGPLSHLLRALGGLASRDMPHSRFADYHHAPANTYWANRIARIKLGYCWPGGAIEQITAPRWETRFNTATTIAASDPTRIVETAFVAVEIKSRYPRTHPRFLSPGSWSYETEDQPRRPSPRIIWAGGWQDPRTWVGGGVSQINNYVWRDEWSYTVLHDSDIGLPPEFSDGQPVRHRVYRIDDYVFAGVNLGESVPIENPYNFPGRSGLPAPIDLDPDAIGYSDADRRRFLTFFGAVGRDNRAMMWSDGFDRNRPRTRHTAIAQATVFNNHSFDLWTQMWYAQSERVTDYDQWVAQMDLLSPGDAIPGLDGRALAELRQQLRAVAPLSPMMLQH